MRPLLPHRDLLLKSVALNSIGTSPRHDKRPRRPRIGLAQFCDDTFAYAQLGDVEALSGVFRKVLDLSSDHDIGGNADESARWLRAVSMNAVLAAASEPMGHHVDAVMGVLTSHGVLDALPPDTIGAVLDVLVRDKLHRGDISAAIRGELISRALDTRLSSGAYSALLSHLPRLDAALSLLHRAVAVDVSPTVPMLNTLLTLCFRAGDGRRARGVISEMALRNLRPNLPTLSILLSRADSVEAVEAVFTVARRDARLSPHAAAIFLRAYTRVGTDSLSDAYIGHCFSTIDWFFDNGIGVERRALDELIVHFSCHGRVEAALRAWREMRRGWLGSPCLRSRRALLVQLVKRGTERDAILCDRLVNDLSPKQVRNVYRTLLRTINDDGRDADALEGPCVKDKASVLHRWGRTGRVDELWTWTENAVMESKGAGIDIRLLLPLLSDVSESRYASVDLFLKHLSSGDSIRGQRADVLERVVNRFWQWLKVNIASANYDDDDVDEEQEEEGVGEEEHADIEGDGSGYGSIVGKLVDDNDFRNDVEVTSKGELLAELSDIVQVSSIDVAKKPEPCT